MAITDRISKKGDLVSQRVQKAIGSGLIIAYGFAFAFAFLYLGPLALAPILLFSFLNLLYISHYKATHALTRFEAIVVRIALIVSWAPFLLLLADLVIFGLVRAFTGAY